MQPASYPLVDNAAQRHHPTDEEVSWGVLLGIGIGLDPEAITYRGDSALEQLSPPGLPSKRFWNEVAVAWAACCCFSNSET
jgi:hypothetical protein